MSFISNKGVILPVFFILCLLPFIYALDDDFGDVYWITSRNYDAYRHITNPYTISTILDSASGDVTGNGRADMVFLRINPSGNARSIILANYSNNQINVISSYTLVNYDYLSEIVLADMDDDGQNEIMIAGSNTNQLLFSALKFDGTDLVQFNTTHTGIKAVTGLNTGQIQMSCDYDGTNRCFINFFGNTIAQAFLIDANSIILNQTTQYTRQNSASTGNVYRYGSTWNGLTYTDVDLDGNYEFITMTPTTTSVGAFSYIIYFRYNVYPTNNNIDAITPTLPATIIQDNSVSEWRKDRSNSLTHNFLPTQDGSKKETFVFYQNSNGYMCYQIVSYLGVNVQSGCYAAISLTGWNHKALYSRGILSNTIMMDITNDGQMSPCVMKYNYDFDKDGTENDNHLICVNPRTDRAYVYKITSPLPNSNIVNQYGENYPDTIAPYNVLDRNLKIFTANLKGKSSSYPYTDIVTPFGPGILLSAQPTTTLSSSSSNDILVTVANPYLDSGVLPGIHPLRNQYADIILIGPNNIWVMDDIYLNAEPTIKWAEFNPGIDGLPIKVNESGYISLILDDAELNPVSAKIVMYADTVYEYETDWVANVSPGIRLNFNIEYNQTISNGKIIIQITDNQEPHVITERTEYFSVATTGIVYNEYKSYIGSDFETTPEGAPGVSNSISNLLTEIDVSFGLNLGTGVLWMIIITVVAGMLWVKGEGSNPMVSLGVISFVTIMLLIVGVTLGFISSWMIVLLMVLAIAIITVSFMGWIRGGTS